MKNIPERIFLTIGDSEPMPDDFKEFDTEFVCWCDDRIHKDDLEYRLVPKNTLSCEDVLRKHIPKPINEAEKNDDINIIKAMEEYAGQLLGRKYCTCCDCPDCSGRSLIG